MTKLSAAALLLALGACTTAPKDIKPTSMPPMMYSNLDCDQVGKEARRLQIEISNVGGRLEEARGNDVKLAVGAIFIWPTLFGLGGMQDKQSEYAMLRGQMIALEQASNEKRCDVQFHPSAPPAQLSPAVAEVPN